MAKHPYEKPDMTGWNWKTKAFFHVLNALRFAELPEKPRIGKNYEVWPEGVITAEGKPSNGLLRLGKKNKLLICFCGGGVSFDAYTAARPNRIGATGQVFYAVDPIAAELLLLTGTNGKGKQNPFRDWTIFVIPYVTGDFHCGRNDFPYTDLNGKPAILRHRGYENTQKLLAVIQRLVPNPEKLIVTGFSAGAFGTSLMADDVIGHFPSCKDVTAIVDSAIMHHDWRRVATEVWGAPKEITERLTGTEIVTDSLLALHQKRPDVKILYCCSCRDSALAQFVGFLEENGNWSPTEQTGDRFQAHLRALVETLQREIPNVGIFIFNRPDPAYTKERLTAHCICASAAAFTVRENGVSVAEWMEKGMSGEPLQLGLENLQ